MKIQKSNKKLLVFIAIFVGIALVIVAGIVVYAQTHHKTTPPPAVSSGLNNINYSKPTTDQQSNGAVIKNNSASQDGKSNIISGSDQPSSPTPIPNSSKSNVSVTITSTSPQSGETIYVNAFVGALTNTGTCTLKFTNTSTAQVITKQVGVQASSTVSVCKGFTLSKTSDKFDIGQWTAVVSFNNDTLTGEATKAFTVQ